MKKDLLTLRDITRNDLEHIFELASKLKAERGKTAFTPLAGKSVGLIFAKSSTRTRVSFEVGVGELGGRPLYLDQSKMQIGRGETVADTAKVLSRYLHGIVIRTFSHAEVEELAREADIPVINALTDEYHPCQILADLLTIREYSGRTDGSIRMAFYGDARSNIANSLILAARLTGMELVLWLPGGGAARPSALRRMLQRELGGGPDEGRRRCRLFLHRRLGQHGLRGGARAAHEALRPVPGQREAVLRREAGCEVPALPARPSRRGGFGRRNG